MHQGLRRPIKHKLFCLQRDDVIGKAGGKIDVVEDEDNRWAAFRQPMDRAHDLNLMGDIECRDRLVEKKGFCPLREQHGKPCPLALTA